MYSALFHVSGIAILEICFYFYYIGPMETYIFEDKVERLAKEPLNLIPDPPSTPIPTTNSITLNNLQIPMNNDFVYYIGSMFNSNNITNENDDDYLNTLNEERKEAIKKREKKNYKLFIKTIEYWLLMVFISVLIYLIVKYYNGYKKLKKVNGIVNVPSRERDEESLELVDLNSYRRSSIDDEHLEANEIQKQLYKKYFYKIIHYIFFGGCIITFQYLFFQNVVLKYDPLSIQEVKYIIYKKIYPEIKEWENITNY